MTPTPCRRDALRGFTLIEMMIVVAIVTILAGIALPSYSEYILRSRRAEARAALLASAQWMERLATATGTYLTDAKNFPASMTTVPSQAYLVSVAVDSTGAGASYTLTATPQNAQVNDKCGKLTLDQTGAQGIVNATAPLAECWNR